MHGSCIGHGIRFCTWNHGWRIVSKVSVAGSSWCVMACRLVWTANAIALRLRKNVCGHTKAGVAPATPTVLRHSHMLGMETIFPFYPFLTDNLDNSRSPISMVLLPAWFPICLLQIACLQHLAMLHELESDWMGASESVASVHSRAKTKLCARLHVVADVATMQHKFSDTIVRNADRLRRYDSLRFELVQHCKMLQACNLQQAYWESCRE